MQHPRAQYTAAQFRHAFPKEGSQVEFKTGVGVAALQEPFVAFSNTNGGVIFAGVTNDGAVKGRALDQGTEEQINQAAFAVHDIGRYEAREVAVDGSRIVAITVQPRQEGFAQTSEGRTMVRQGPANVALFGQDLQDFINRRSLKRFERAESTLRLDEIDSDLLSELSAVMQWDRMDRNSLRSRLTERGLCCGETLTIAGALFLSRPQHSLSLSKAVVEVRRYTDEGPDYDRRLIFDGPLHHQVRATTDFILNELGSDLIVTGLYRHELPKLPEVVVREAIANAVAHRTYEVDRTSVLVELRPSQVVIRSPGGLPEPVTVKTIRAAQAARNPTIIDVLRKFALAEDAGRGIDVIEDRMQDALLDPPSFQDDGSFVIATLPLSGPITGRERAWIAELERRGSLNSPDRLLVVHAARGQVLTNKAARSILNTADSGEARKSLQRLRDTGIFIQYGDRGSAEYRLTESIAPPAAYRMSRVELVDMVISAAEVSSISNEDVRDLTGLSRQDALAMLRQLVRTGRLRQTGSKRGTRYTL